ncbi:MAG: hypothetical protein Q4E02_04515 [Lagierella massiliensis]|nr:hypothetical protein [Lagierella massiliensis]
MKNWFFKFMQGRNGVNHFSRFLSSIGLLIWIIALFFERSTFGNFLSLFGIGCILYSNFIIFSRDKVQRNKENQDYLNLRNKFISIFSKNKNKILNSKKYKYLKCPNCKTEMRVPKGKGKIKIHCKNCGEEFLTKS